jgi:hypothetical protein
VTTHALPHRPAFHAARHTALVALGSALAGGLAILALIGLVRLAGGSGERAAAHAYTAPGHAFSIAVPGGWSALSGADLARVPGGAAALLRRADGRGIVVVRRSAPVRGDLRAVAVALTSDLSRRFAGFRLVSARLGRVRAGGAFLYTFVRGPRGAAQSLAITRVRGVTYRIDSVVRGDSPDAAREAGAIVGSFGP